jgi:3-methyladenine DNA glycosylase AlkD
VRRLRALADPTRLAGMARYGIDTSNALGLSVTELRGVAKDLGRDHDLAAALWATGIHEARMLATLVDEPARVTGAQMDAWVADIRSWDLCDGACGNLFDRTPFWREKAIEWAARTAEFEKRAGFALMAWAAVHRKDEPDATFAAFIPIVEAQSDDDRVYVRKAVNWALRQIGKRSRGLHPQALRAARRIANRDARSARWIASDAIRELESPAVRERLLGKAAAP